MKCAITGKECLEQSSEEGSYPCNICKVGKEWLDGNNGIVLHDEK